MSSDGLIPLATASSTQWYLMRLLVVVSVILFLSPIWMTFPQEMLPSHYPDALEFVWTAWRMEGVIQGTRALYETNELYYPTGASLLLHTVCGAVLYPITYVAPNLSPVWRFNFGVFACFTLTGISAISLFRALAAGPWQSLFFGMVLTFSPFIVGHLEAGHLNFLAVFPLVELLRALLVSTSNQSWHRTDGYRFVVAVVLLPLCNLYYLYFGALLLAGFALISLNTGRTVASVFKREVALFALGLAPNLIHLLAVARLAASGTYTPDHDPRKHSADLLSFLVPSANQLIGDIPFFGAWRSGVSLHAGESSLYLGYSVTFLAGVGLWLSKGRERAISTGIVLLILCFLVLSFGPVLTFGGVGVVRMTHDSFLRSVLPFFPSVPVRFGLLVFVLLLCLASRGVTLLGERGYRYLIAGLLLTAACEYAPHFPAVTKIEVESESLRTLQLDPSVRAVVDQAAIPQRAMLRQTIHQKPLIGGFLSRRPRLLQRSVNRNPFVRWLLGRGVFPQEQLLLGWCGLRGDRLLLEGGSPIVNDPLLHEMGFRRLGFDRDLNVYALVGHDCGYKVEIY
jgi:hypothetical protein